MDRKDRTPGYRGNVQPDGGRQSGKHDSMRKKRVNHRLPYDTISSIPHGIRDRAQVRVEMNMYYLGVFIDNIIDNPY
jgi:hypothetical protein